MQALIATGEKLDERLTIVKIVDATMPEIELEVIEEIDKPEPIEDLNEDQPDIPDKQLSVADGPSLNIERQVVEVDTTMELSSASISATDGDYLPLVAIAPQYPTRAASRGIQGWCLVSFTVDGFGNVIEDTIIVVDAEPPSIFDRSSERAARRFKFQPRVVDGEGVEVSGVQYLFTYILEGDP
jgi:protein TonB